MKNIFFILIIFSFSSFAKTYVAFVDACSGKQVNLSTPNGTRLKIALSDLDPNEDLTITVFMRPAGVFEDLQPKDQYKMKFVFNRRNGISADGTLNKTIRLPKKSWMSKVESRHSEYRVWDAEVIWTQTLAQKAGSALATYYRAVNNGPYFQLKSAGLCQWEQEASISSKLYVNDSQSWMNVSRESNDTWDESSINGMTLGWNNSDGSSIPLSPLRNQNSILGWMFKEYQTQFNSQRIFRIERRYVLNQSEVGLYISRLSFNRHEARKYLWDKKPGSCGEFRAVSEGYLDVGRNSEDFLVIPRNYYPRPDLLQNYISVARPTLNNCEMSVGAGPEYASESIPAGNQGILFYYENNSLKGDI